MKSIISKKLYLVIFCATYLILQPIGKAAEYKSKLGLSVGTGNVTTKLAGDDPDLGIQGGILFERKLENNSSIVTQYSEGSADFCFLTCFSGESREVDWYSLQLNYKKSFVMTKRWASFARVGLNYYQSEFGGNFSGTQFQSTEVEKSGFDYVVAIGLEFEANNGFFIGFEAQHMPMDIIDTNTYNMFVGYSF